MESTYRNPSVVDVMTAGAHGVARRLTDTIEEGIFDPNNEVTGFYHRWKEDIDLLAGMGIKTFQTLIADHEFYR